ncbi:hypothetical protein NQ314_006695 [Rhamnusium bicolor]|uniref:Uncharacterized protein n=1 Tax=Rhamnusium bicolor TaxID=1586634 RepID=A0AAV8Z0K7_9CUCU|nr:hypothetical protein NQ314_006695 [Rhamnusium bicolor]
MTDLYYEEDEIWKLCVRSEDESDSIWKNNWGWILDVYNELTHKSDETTANSTYLASVTEEYQSKEDRRKLSKLPESTNHMYGWIAKDKEFKLNKYGPDKWEGLPLPTIYKVPRH